MAAKKKAPAKKFKVEEVGEATPDKETVEKKEEVKQDETSPTPATDTSGTQPLSSFKLADMEKDGAAQTEVTPADAPATEDPAPAPEVVPEKTAAPVTTTDEAQDWLKDVNSEGEEGPEEGKKSKKKTFLIIFVILLVLGLIGGGFYYYQANMKDDTTTETQPSEEVVIAEPTSAPAEEVEEEEEIVASEYTISILNGSGIAGEAGKVEDLLIEAGFEEIETGNADAYDYIETQVSVTEDAPSGLYSLVEESLEGAYTVILSEDNLDEDSDYDVEIIVGSEKAESDVE